MSTTLSVKKRELIGSNACKHLRKNGQTPGVVYGEKKDVVPVSFDSDDLIPFLKKATPVISIDIEGEEANIIIKDVQFDPLGDDIVHADFHRVSMDKKITVPVSLDFVGTPKSLSSGGKLSIQRREINVTGLPGDIPERVSVNIEALAIGQQIRAKDLNISENLTLELAPGALVLKVQGRLKGMEENQEEEAK